MKYVVGQTVVYPHHGAAKIIDIADQTVAGVTRTYLTLEVEDKNSQAAEEGINLNKNTLTIKIAEDAMGKVGVRDVISKKQVDKVKHVIQEEHIEEAANWSRRFKANQEKLKTGDFLKIAEIVRDLTRRQQDKHVSAGEKRMLAKARQILASELALALKKTEAGAQDYLDEILGV